MRYEMRTRLSKHLRWRIAGAFVALSALAALAALGASTLSAAPAPGSLATFTVDRSDPNNPVNKYTWTVPKGVKAVTFDAFGATGGSRYRPGSIGGEAKGTFSVTPGTVFEIVVGGVGGVGCSDGCPGLNGGGPSGADVGGGDSGSGGGGSDVRAGSCAAGLSCTFADRIVVGGGGGGDAVWNGDFNPNQNCYPIWTSYGGYGGDTSGSEGSPPRLATLACYQPLPPDTNLAEGGSQTDPGKGGLFGRGAGYGGGDGGGGGGGWFGGGSGQYSGGGGGSGHVDPLASSASMRTGIDVYGDGQVVIYKG
jgi:hypothetical protein